MEKAVKIPLGGKGVRCYFCFMDSHDFLPHRKRGMIFLIVAVVMLVLGETVLRNALSRIPFLLYWLGCFLCTGLAILFALRDVFGVQRQARIEQRELLEKTVNEIARQKEIRARRGNSGSNPE